MKRYESFTIRTLLASAGLAMLVAAAPVLAADHDAPKAHSDSMGAAISDTGITAKVKAKLAGAPGLKDADIHVTTTNGVVTLTGRAASAEGKDRAEELAEGVEGVKHVDNELSTPSGSQATATVKHAAAGAAQGTSDGWITTKVKSALLADSVTKGFDVHVETTNGVVVLTGQLPNHDAVAHAKDVAEKIDGVKSVDTSGLTVGQS